MSEKRFMFNSFVIEDMIEDKELKLYEIDNNPCDDLDESNLFYVYSTSDENIKSIVNKLNELTEENEQLKQKNKELEKRQGRMYQSGTILSESNRLLKEENEQLKQQSNSVYEIVKEYVMSHHCISTMRMLKKIEKVMWNDYFG